jgi:hypothetical protein
MNRIKNILINLVCRFLKLIFSINKKTIKEQSYYSGSGIGLNNLNQ